MQEAEDMQKMLEAEKWAAEETQLWLQDRYAYWKDCEDWADEETKIWLAQQLPPDNVTDNKNLDMQGMVTHTYSVRLLSLLVIKD